MTWKPKRLDGAALTAIIHVLNTTQEYQITGFVMSMSLTCDNLTVLYFQVKYSQRLRFTVRVQVQCEFFAVECFRPVLGIQAYHKIYAQVVRIKIFEFTKNINLG